MFFGTRAVFRHMEAVDHHESHLSRLNHAARLLAVYASQ
jgi:hypothetical protein